MFAKVNLIAEKKAVLALANFLVQISSTFTRLMVSRAPLSTLIDEINLKTELIKGCERTRDEMLTLMQQHNIEGDQDMRRFEVLRKNFDFEAKRIADFDGERQLLQAELEGKKVGFIKECFGEVKSTSKVACRCLLRSAWS